MYEEEDCSTHFYGGMYTHEMCCRDQSSCMTENPDCSYSDDWTGKCPSRGRSPRHCHLYNIYLAELHSIQQLPFLTEPPGR